MVSTDVVRVLAAAQEPLSSALSRAIAVEPFALQALQVTWCDGRLLVAPTRTVSNGNMRSKVNDGNQKEQNPLNMFELQSLLSPHQDCICCSPGFKRTSDRHNWLAVSDMFLYVVLVLLFCYYCSFHPEKMGWWLPMTICFFFIHMYL